MLLIEHVEKSSLFNFVFEKSEKSKSVFSNSLYLNVQFVRMLYLKSELFIIELIKFILSNIMLLALQS